MDDEEILFKTVKKDLPNFPDDVIREWLLPYAIKYGWPPERSSEPSTWRNILGEEIVDWKKRVWKLEEIDLTTLTLSPWATISAEEMLQAYTSNAKNAYSSLRDSSGAARHISAVRYLVGNGRFPKPLMLKNTSLGLEIVDGNHRFLAWRTTRDMLAALKTLPQDQSEDFKKKVAASWGVDPMVTPSDIQLTWIAR